MRRNTTIVLMCRTSWKNGLEEWTEHIYKASGMFKDQPDQPPAFAPLAQVPTQPDQPRSHIPTEASDFDPLQRIKIPCFDDELTRVRFTGACDLCSGCHTAKQHLDHLYRIV